MAIQISALEKYPNDFIREVSPETIRFFVEDLSGIYLPEDFKSEHSEAYGVRNWESKDRLRGKFGRFTVRDFEDEDSPVDLDDVLVMGTTIGLTELDQRGDFYTVRHCDLGNMVWDVLRKVRGLTGEVIEVDAADYGSTSIVLGEAGSAKAIRVSGSSGDYGRATAEGRQKTCELFTQLVGNGVEIINSDPEPRLSENIIK